MNMSVQRVLETFVENAHKNVEKTCIADKSKALSYNELLDRTMRIARYLRDMNIDKGCVVGIRASQSVEFVAAYLGIQYAGAVPCAIEKSASVERTAEVLSDISTEYMIESNVTQKSIPGRMDLDDAYNYSEKEDVIAKRDITDDAEIIFTTGTTGSSKGIRISYSAEMAIAENVIDSVAMSPEQVELITTPVSHSLAIRRIMTALYIGSTAVLSEQFLIYNNFWGLIERYQVTAIATVPSVIKLIMEAYGDKLADYDSQLAYVQFSSAPLHEELKAKLCQMLPTTRLYNIYGSTESGCTAVLEFSKYTGGSGCIGRPTVNTKVLFTDKNRNHIDNAGDEASACLLAFEGPMNMTGYINEEGFTLEVLDKDVLYTNDIGYIGDDGMLYLMGRSGEVINSGGLKINPSEIEETVLEMDDVTDCACIPVEDDRRGEVPMLFVVLRDGCELDTSKIKVFIRSKLEEYKIPDVIEVTDVIPRTFNGKIRKSELKQKYQKELKG